MDQLASAAALVLAAVFAWAGIAKLMRRDDTRSSFAALRLPAPSTLAVAVPIVEILLAIGLVFRPAIAAWAAIGVIGAFTVVIWLAIARGIDAPCSCFGTARKEPVSTNEIVRNGMLAGLAVVATAAHGAAGWPGLPHLVIVTVLTAMGRVILAIADLRRGGNRIFPDMPGRA